MRCKTDEILCYMSCSIQNLFAIHSEKNVIESIEEIRLRSNRPLMIHTSNGSYVINKLTGFSKDINSGYICTEDDLQKTFQNVCENSVYAYLEEIRQGFITVNGGHRVGICGQVVSRNGKIENIKCVGGLNFRLTREILSSANELIKKILHSEGVTSTLVISSPGCGKTTILRDVARQISNKGFKVGIADERCEIAACYRGIPQNDVGIQTDVLYGCAKAKAITMLLRSMNPKVIITDEIANQSDCQAVTNAINSGVSVVASAHSKNCQELKNRSDIRPLIENRFFKNIAVLSRKNGAGTLEKIVCL